MSEQLTTEHQAAIIEAKEVLASKQDVLMAIGQMQALNNIKKYTTVGELLIFKKIKESNQYKGLVYTSDDGKSTTVGDIKELCEVFFGRSYTSMAESLQNLEAFGQEFLESSQNMGLGNRELRKLRKLPEAQQLAVINSEEVDLGDKTAVKDLIEDIVLQHNNETSELKKELKEATDTVRAVRANADDKQQTLDELKEKEAQRQFSQTPWKHQTADICKGLLEARALVEQGVKQMEDAFNHVNDVNAPLSQEAVDYCARTLLSEATNLHDVVSHYVNNVTGMFGAIYKPDSNAAETLLAVNEPE
ncbi:hypothetical protein tloyanaT_25930 [Thalassotalea loyana]|uniref:DUF3102 domain-containing protein n=1 Tax=Thalassotalea loyana TaxID=280483 RepID=A0ABQ6HDZ0_9GAMM|nr:hypothetical protein [Thalassotalea loyana]GLX86340.1 hypothetical protein tloyanaT_25930 [Thalassotalea loyana]